MNLRSSNKVKLKTSFTKLTRIQRSPYYRGLKPWDQLPENVQKERSKLVFKSKSVSNKWKMSWFKPNWEGKRNILL